MAEVSRVAVAEEYAAELAEPGYAAATITAKAWAEGVDPAVTRNLITAAACLGGMEARTYLAAKEEPHPSSVEFIEDVTDLDAAVNELGRRGVTLGKMFLADRETAREQAQQAKRDEKTALAKAAAATEDNKGAYLADAEAARERYAEARRVQADADAALETIEDCLDRINPAVKALWLVPGDFTEYFDVPLELAARGVRMPHDGYFFGQGEAA